MSFTGIEFKHNSGNAFEINFNTPKTIDLLALQGDEFDFLLDEQAISSGTYNWMRLKVMAQQNSLDSYIELDTGTQHALYIPSGSETGLKLNQSFTIPSTGNLDLTIDFDLRKPVIAPQSGTSYILKPSLRLLQTDLTGHISGTVDGTVLQGANCSGTDYAVYAYQGTDIVPDDVDGINSDPITTSQVKLNNQGLYGYTLGFLNEGSYTVTFTCDAGSDNPDSNDMLNYIGTRNVTVLAGQTAIHNF